MTFNQYIENPLGKHNAVFSQRDMFKELYRGKLDNILLREAGKINYQLFYDNNDRYYIHIKIPSEVVNKFYYDVVIMFYSDKAEYFNSNTLRDYNIKVFSNDPSFCFTYLYVFNKNDMFFEDLKEKAPKASLKDAPIERNPQEIVGYVKSLFFAYLYMRDHNLFNKFYYKNNGIKYNKKDLLMNVEHATSKIEKRQQEGEKIRKAEKKIKEQMKNKSNSFTKSKISSPLVKSTKIISKTPFSSKIKRTHNIKKK